MSTKAVKLIREMLAENLAHGEAGDAEQRTKMEEVLSEVDEDGFTESERSMIDYILTAVEEDFVSWCGDENHEVDSDDARAMHIYGIACTALDVKPSELLPKSLLGGDADV